MPDIMEEEPKITPYDDHEMNNKGEILSKEEKRVREAADKVSSQDVIKKNKNEKDELARKTIEKNFSKDMREKVEKDFRQAA